MRLGVSVCTHKNVLSGISKFKTELENFTLNTLSNANVTLDCNNPKTVRPLKFGLLPFRTGN